MTRSTLLAFVLAFALAPLVTACTQQVDDGSEPDSIADPQSPPLEPNYAPGEGPEPPEGYCQPFTTHKDVYSPQELELDLLYCYDYSDLMAWVYVAEHGGISCGTRQHLYAPWTNQTFHCGTRWYVWVPY
jgi:hypothetical protein